jgi:histidyl-tRNA synthetase
VEAFGDPGPAVDAELIELGLRFYRDAGLADVEVLVNSIGDPDCRPAYVAGLAAYFGRHEEALPELERRRLATNPLRLLDSKEPTMAALIAAAPRSIDGLCDACAAHFAAVRAHLDAVGIPHRVEPALVRGLDYYTRTTFEFYRRGEEGKQQALGGGGRLDGLVALLGGKPTPAIGFALGLDRVVLALEAVGAPPAEEPVPIAVVVGADPADTAGRLAVATRLRDSGLAVGADLSQRKLGRQLETAVKEGAQFAVILGDELATGDVQLRDLDGASQKLVPLADLAALLHRKTPGA